LLFVFYNAIIEQYEKCLLNFEEVGLKTRGPVVERVLLNFKTKIGGRRYEKNKRYF
jgi:hypothetical protein